MNNDNDLNLEKHRYFWEKHPALNFALSLLLIIIIAVCIIITIYIVNTDGGESFTEFYMLNSDGQAENYPTSINLEEETSIILVIINHENSRQIYNIDIIIKDTLIKQIGPIHLEKDEKWENPVSIKPEVQGDNQKVEFILNRQFRNNREDNSPLSLRLFLNVQ